MNADVDRRRRLTQESIDRGLSAVVHAAVDVRVVLRAAAAIVRDGRPFLELALLLGSDAMSARRFAEILDEVAERLDRPEASQITQEEAAADLSRMGLGFKG